MPTTSNDSTPQTSTKDGHSGNGVGNVNGKAATDHHPSLLNKNSSNATSTDAITTTTDANNEALSTRQPIMKR